MLISKILENVSTKKSYSKDIDINNISDDSRKIGKGDMFVAVCGAVADGHAFVETAIGNGAIAVVVNRLSDVPCLAKYPDIQVIEVEDTAKALGEIAANYYGRPSESLNLVGITGTNGKTTTATNAT